MAFCLSEEREGAPWPKQEIRSKARSPARIVFLKTARDTNGELLQLDDVMKGGGRVPIEHVHPYMEERFEILSGTARLSIRGQERDVGAGETVVVPAGTPHVWGNPNEDEVHLILEFRPALRMETWFETFFGLQKDGKINPKSGLPNALQWAVISREYEDEIYLASPPLLVQRVRFGLLATIGKLLGYKARYPAYSGAEEPLAGREGERPSAASGAMRGHRSWIYRCVNCAIVASTRRPFGQKKIASVQIASVPTSENSGKRKSNFAEFTFHALG